MKSLYEIKNVSDSVLDVDDNSRKVKVAISEMGSLDLDNDVIDSGAYTKTLKERGPQGANLIWHLTDHNPSIKTAIGKFSELYIEGNKLVGVTDIPNTSWGNDMLEFYKTGHINQHSIGFRTIKREPVNAGKSDEYNLIKEVLLYEGSAVLWGANPNTPTLSAGKSATKEEAEAELVKLQDELQLLTKSLKDGRFTDSGFEFVEMRLNQVSERMKNLFTSINTQPANAVEPKNEEIENTVKNIFKLLSIQ